MNKKITISNVIKYIICAIAAILILSVWPLKLITRSYSSVSNVSDVVASGECSEETNVAQLIISDGDRIESVDVYVLSDISDTDVKFVLYDANLESIYSRVVEVSDFEAPGYLHVPMNLRVDRGMAYVYSLYSEEGTVVLGLEDHMRTSNSSSLAMTYGGVEDAEHNVISIINYDIYFTWWQIVLIDVLIASTALLLIIVTRRLIGTRFADKEYRVQTVLRWVFNPIIVIVSVFLLWQIFPRMIYSDKVINVIFWSVGVLMATGLALYMLNYRRSDDEPIEIIVYIREHPQQCLTVIAIANVLWYCFEYMNGLYDIHHAYAARRVLIWFGIMLITTFDKKEVLNIFNLIWAIVGAVISYLVYKPWIGTGETELTYKLTAIVIFIGGFILINVFNTVLRIIKDKSAVMTKHHINVAYCCATILFFAAICILANTRWEPLFMTVLVALLLLRLCVWKDGVHWLNILCNGIILNFIYMMVFSLLHRPYYGYIYHRYNMCYLTVTMTATHLTLCLAAITYKLVVCSIKTKDVRKLLPWMTLYGIIADYQIMTMSRTGYISVIAMTIVILIVVAAGHTHKGERIYGTCKKTVLMIVSVLALFPVTFTFTRIIPPLVDDPVIYEYEPCMVTIYKGAPADQEYYMDLPRFKDVFLSKVFGIGDASAMIDDIIIPDDEIGYIENYMLLASASDADMGDIEALEESREMSNGRFDIFRSYLEQSNLWGHDEMGAILKDGSVATHAHNIYIQAIYDHGWVFGVYFILFLAYTWGLGVYVAYRDKDCSLLLIPTLVTGFMVAGLVEWIFHPCNPYAMSILMIIPALILHRTEKPNEENC